MPRFHPRDSGPAFASLQSRPTEELARVRQFGASGANGRRDDRTEESHKTDGTLLASRARIGTTAQDGAAMDDFNVQRERGERLREQVEAALSKLNFARSEHRRLFELSADLGPQSSDGNRALIQAVRIERGAARELREALRAFEEFFRTEEPRNAGRRK